MLQPQILVGKMKLYDKEKALNLIEGCPINSEQKLAVILAMTKIAIIVVYLMYDPSTTSV